MISYPADSTQCIQGIGRVTASAAASESNCVPLLRRIASQTTRRNVLDLFASGSSRLCCHAIDWLQAHLSPDEMNRLLQRGLERDVATQFGILQTLTTTNVDLDDKLCRHLQSLLSNSDAEIRRAATSLIARHRPDDAELVLNEPLCCHDHECLRRLCLADRPDLVIRLMDAFGFPDRKPPPTIGFLVTPGWLAQNHSTHPEHVEWLIRECGYCDDPVGADVLEVLSLGFSFVAAPMNAAGPADQWLLRVRSLVWQLMLDPAEEPSSGQLPPDLNDPLQEALFLAAVRDADRLIFAQNRIERPWKTSDRRTELSPVAFHASARYVRLQFLTNARRKAEELNVGDAAFGQFVLDHARCVLEPVLERRVAEERSLRCRWRVRGSDPPVPARELVIGAFQSIPVDSELSPCAQSICQLADLAGIDSEGLAQWLLDRENQWARQLTTIGLELQIPTVPVEDYCAWKEALPYLGIPSPERPEFGGMVEAAFAPSHSWHAVLLAPLLLLRVGLISAPQDIAMHISLQGDLDRQARYLAFPQLFIHPSTRLKNRPDSTMTRVMSKGLVHRNSDVLRLSRRSIAEDSRFRTELRMFRVFCDEVRTDRKTVIVPTFVLDVIGTHLIGSAMLGSCRRCNQIARDYSQQVETEAARQSAEFMQLLNSNFYEATGDPHDETLMFQLPVFRAWSAVRRIVRDHNLGLTFDQTLRDLRSRFINQLRDHFTSDHGIDWQEETDSWNHWIRQLKLDAQSHGLFAEMAEH